MGTLQRLDGSSYNGDEQQKVLQRFHATTEGDGVSAVTKSVVAGATARDTHPMDKSSQQALLHCVVFIYYK